MKTSSPQSFNYKCDICEETTAESQALPADWKNVTISKMVMLAPAQRSLDICPDCKASEVTSIVLKFKEVMLT